MSIHTKRRLSAIMAGLALALCTDALISLTPASAAGTVNAAAMDTVQVNASDSGLPYHPLCVGWCYY
jgi:hypothetical protein